MTFKRDFQHRARNAYLAVTADECCILRQIADSVKGQGQHCRFSAEVEGGKISPSAILTIVEAAGLFTVKAFSWAEYLSLAGDVKVFTDEQLFSTFRRVRDTVVIAQQHDRSADAGCQHAAVGFVFAGNRATGVLVKAGMIRIGEVVNGKLYRLRSLREHGFQVWQYVKDDEAVVITVVEHAAEALPIIRLKGLQEEALYQVGEGETAYCVSGAFLMQRGIRTASNRDLNGTVLRIRKVEE